MTYVVSISKLKGLVQRRDKSTFYRKWVFHGRNIYILVEESEESVYYFQRHLKMNNFPPIVIHEIKDFVLLIPNNFKRWTLLVVAPSPAIAIIYVTSIIALRWIVSITIYRYLYIYICILWKKCMRFSYVIVI